MTCVSRRFDTLLDCSQVHLIDIRAFHQTRFGTGIKKRLLKAQNIPSNRRQRKTPRPVSAGLSTIFPITNLPLSSLLFSPHTIHPNPFKPSSPPSSPSAPSFDAPAVSSSTPLLSSLPLPEQPEQRPRLLFDAARSRLLELEGLSVELLLL